MKNAFRTVLSTCAVGIPIVLILSVHAFAAGNPEKGKHVYEKHCLLCHGPEGRGDGPQGKLMSPPAADFHAPEIQKKSDKLLLKAIKGGHSGSAMTGFEYELNREELNNVLSYIRKLGGSDKGI